MDPKKKKTIIIILIVVFSLLILCICALVIILGINYHNYLNNPNNILQVTPTSSSNDPGKVIPAATELSVKTTQYCHALTDPAWAMISNAQGTGADVYSLDKIYHAGWGIAGVPKFMNPTVDSFLTYFMKLGHFGDITMGATSDLGYGFVSRDFSSPNGRQGVLVYKVYNFSADVYVVSVYMADTPAAQWETAGGKAELAMLSIRCVSQLRPATPSVDSGSDPSSSTNNPEVDLSDQWQEAIMGFENVYSPTTGEHFQPSVNDYWATGPDGGGYYRDLPNGGYEKLVDGYGDY